jgi:hypothetical protein
MRRVARALVPPTLLALTALTALASAARAQAPVATWTLEQVADRFCVSYLVEPELARTLAGSRFVPVAAERVEGLHPAVAQLVAGEPAYRAWVPAEICVIEAGRLVSGARTASEGSRALVLGYSAMAATPVGGGEIMMRGGLFSTSGSVRRLAGDQLIHVDGVKYSKGTVPEGTDERRIVGLQGATLTWDGRILDSASAATDRPRTLAVDGKRNRALAVGVNQSAEWERATVGTLKVQGKSDFAAGILGSPIRMVGPVTGGGTVSLDFTRR